MFEDIIFQDENVMLQALRQNESDIDNFKTLLQVHAHEMFSKESEKIQYNYGRLNGMVPERPLLYLHSYPKKATNLDTDHHHLSFDTEILTRWISRDVLKIFVPVLYFQDLRKQKKAEALFAKSVPTMQELQQCQALNGVGFWKRDGSWHCTRENIPIGDQDQYGQKVFSSYNDWIAWDSRLQSEINQAKSVENWEKVLELRRVKYSLNR